MEQNDTTNETQEEVVETQEQAQEEAKPDQLVKENAILRRKLTKLEKALSDEEETQEQPSINNPDPQLQERLDRMELRQMGYSQEQIDAAMKMGGMKALDNPVFKKGLEALAEDVQDKKAVSIKSTSTGQTVYEPKDEAVKKMSAAEYKEYLQKGGK